MKKVQVGFRTRYYIDDFVEDLNYKGIILYIGNVDIEKLRAKLEEDACNKMWRFDFAVNFEDPAFKNFIYIENCDMQDLDYPVHEYMTGECESEEYSVHNLHYDDKAEMFYIKSHLD